MQTTPATILKTTRDRITDRLEQITIGHTARVGNRVVTRWSASRYEVGTWGRTLMTDLYGAAFWITESERD